MKKVIITIISLLMFNISVSASNYNMYLGADSTTVTSGTESNINITLSNIGVSNGLNACQASISSSGGITINGISGYSGWNATNGSILVMDSSNNATGNTTIANINVIINSEGSISLTNINCTNGEEEFTTNNTSISFKIKQEEVQTTKKVEVNNTTTKPVTTTKKQNSNYLSNLTIEGYEIVFDKNTLEYNLTVDNSVNDLKINYILEDNTSKVEIVGNENFVVGNNIVELKVTNALNETKIYKINVLKEEKVEYVNNNEEEILKYLETNKEVVVKVDLNDSNKLINTNILKVLKDNNKNITYKIYDNNKLVYTFKVYGKYIQNLEPINFNIKFNTDYNINIKELVKNKDYKIINIEETKVLPKDTEIVIYDSVFKDDMKLYFINPNTKEIEYISHYDKLNGSIKLNIEYGTEYLLTNYSNNNKTILILAIIIIIILILILNILILVKRKTK